MEYLNVEHVVLHTTTEFIMAMRYEVVRYVA